MYLRYNKKFSWILKQSTSLAHILAFVAFSIISILSMGKTFWGAGIALFLFLIVTTYSQLEQLIIVAIVATVISVLFPPIAGILAIISIIMFISKLKVLLDNWRAVLAGLFLYLYPFYIHQYYNVKLLHSKSFFLYHNKMHYPTDSPNKIMYIVISIVLFQAVMTFLYYFGYSSSGALSIMRMLPFMILIFLIPSVISDLHNTMNSFNDYNSYSYNTTNPNTHFVKGHYRNTPSGDITYVGPHIQTNPDGIETNNISYKK